MRIQGLIAATAASVLVVAMGAIAAIAGHVSSRDCGDCGVVVAVHAIDPRAKAVRRYHIQVRMSDGSVQTLTSSTAPAPKAGDRVRLQNGRLAG